MAGWYSLIIVLKQLRRILRYILILSILIYEVNLIYRVRPEHEKWIWPGICCKGDYQRHMFRRRRTVHCAVYQSLKLKYLINVLSCRNIFEMNSINNHFHFRYHHVAFIYLRRLLPTISMRVLEARTIQGFLPKVNYIFEQLLAPSGLYTSPYLNEKKNKWYNVLQSLLT